MKFPAVSFATWSHNELVIHMARYTYNILTAVAQRMIPTYDQTSQQCTDHSHATKMNLLPSYATLPFLNILSNIIAQDRDGPKETTTWWALVAQRDLQ